MMQISKPSRKVENKVLKLSSGYSISSKVNDLHAQLVATSEGFCKPVCFRTCCPYHEPAAVCKPVEKCLPIFFRTFLLLHQTCQEKGDDDIKFTELEFSLLSTNIFQWFEKIPTEASHMLVTDMCLPAEDTVMQSRFPYCKESITVKNTYQLASDFGKHKKVDTFDCMLPVIPRTGGNCLEDTRLIPRSLLSGALRFQLSLVTEVEVEVEENNWEVFSALFSIPRIQEIGTSIKKVMDALKKGEPAPNPLSGIDDAESADFQFVSELLKQSKAQFDDDNSVVERADQDKLSQLSDGVQNLCRFLALLVGHDTYANQDRGGRAKNRVTTSLTKGFLKIEPIEDAVTTFDDPVVDPVHIASTVPTMDLYHTESKLDMRTLLVMNPQDLAEQGIGVEKFFENVKEVANSMRDRQRQATVSDALCAKSVFDQQEDGSVFSYVEIFPFPKMSTSKRFFYSTVVHEKKFLDFIIVHDSTHPFVQRPDGCYMVLPEARCFYMIDVAKTKAPRSNANGRFSGLAIVSSTTRKQKDNQNANTEMTELIESVSPCCKFKEQNTADYKFNQKMWTVLSSPQLMLFVHPESEAGKKIYDPRFKETTSIAILCELMDIAAEKRKDESDTYKKSIKDSLVRLCESHARGGFKKIFAKAKKALMTMQPELIYHELNKTLGFARFCKKSHNTPVTSTWKEVLLQLKKVYKKSHKEATAPIMTLVNKPIFYAGKFNDTFILGCPDNHPNNFYVNFDAVTDNVVKESVFIRNNVTRDEKVSVDGIMLKLGKWASENMDFSQIAPADKAKYDRCLRERFLALENNKRDKLPLQTTGKRKRPRDVDEDEDNEDEDDEDEDDDNEDAPDGSSDDDEDDDEEEEVSEDSDEDGSEDSDDGEKSVDEQESDDDEEEEAFD